MVKDKSSFFNRLALQIKDSYDAAQEYMTMRALEDADQELLAEARELLGNKKEEVLALIAELMEGGTPSEHLDSVEVELKTFDRLLGKALESPQPINLMDDIENQMKIIEFTVQDYRGFINGD